MATLGDYSNKQIDSGATLKKSGFSTLADQFEKEVVMLRENVFELNNRFDKALKPEIPVPTGKDCDNEPMRSPIENFIYSQMKIIQECNTRIMDYNERCCF